MGALHKNFEIWKKGWARRKKGYIIGAQENKIMKKLFILYLSLILTIMLLLTGCGSNPGITADGGSATVSATDNTQSADTENPAQSPGENISSTPESTADSRNTTSESNKETSSPAGTPPPGTSSKPTETPAGTSKPTESSKPTETPAASAPPVTSEPPASSTPPTTPTPTYEIMGLDFRKEVLRGLNERRAALGLTPAKLDSDLSAVCLVQAKKMADAGYTFHSETMDGCEGCARVPYNHPADLLGDVMCTHVPDFLCEENVRIGVAVIKKGNYLYAVVQGAP